MGVGVKQIGENTYRLSDTLLGVGQYLLKGSKRALLIDTGYGNEKFRRIVYKLCGGLPLDVANTHMHPDHSKGNGLFGKVYISSADMPSAGLPSNVLFNGIYESVTRAYPLSKCAMNAAAKLALIPERDGAEYMPMPEIFDLGGRTVEVIPCPGHTPGSVLFADSATRAVYAGDAVNQSFWLFTGAETSASGYAATLESVRQKLKGVERIYAAHSSKPLGINFFDTFTAHLCDINSARCKVHNVPGMPEPLLVSKFEGVDYASAVLLYKSQTSDAGKGRM